MKPWLFVVNGLSTLKPDMSTAEWMWSAAARGHDVRVARADDLDVLPDGTTVARVRRLPARPTVKASLSACRADDARPVSLADAGVVILRTNPGRDPRTWRHEIALQQLAQAADDGVVVLNDPRTLLRARSKLYLGRLPQHTRPRTLVSRDPATIRRFLAELDGRAVIKPLVGTHGRDVFLLEGPRAPNLSQVIDVLVREGFAMVQEYIPEAVEGDIRLLLVEGELLSASGRHAAVRRVPPESDFRSNVHAGGRPDAAEMTPALLQLVEDVGPVLRADRLFLVGLDVIGTKVVEVNVFSPGGFASASAFAGADFMEALVDRVEEHLGLRAPPPSA